MLPGLDNSYLLLLSLDLVESVCTYVFIYIRPRRAACGILVPQPGIEPVPPAMEARSPNHWTTREFPESVFIT